MVEDSPANEDANAVFLQEELLPLKLDKVSFIVMYCVFVRV